MSLWAEKGGNYKSWIDPSAGAAQGAFLMPLHIPINGDNLNWTFLGVGLTAALAYVLWHWPKPGAAAP